MGMYDEIKYKEKIYQTKSLDCTMSRYEVKNNQLWQIFNGYKKNHELYKMSNFSGDIELHDHKLWIKFEFIDGTLVKEQAGHYHYEI